MKSNLLYILNCLCILYLLSSCSNDDTVSIYLPLGEDVYSEVISITDEPYEIKFVVSIAGADFATVHKTAPNDITVNLDVDLSLIDFYNTTCGTNYVEMPGGSYSVPATALIEAGTSFSDSLTLVITAKGKFESFIQYMLPVRISGISGADAYPSQQVIYFALSGVEDAGSIPLYDRSNWQVIDFSTEEPGEGGGNGLAICMIDDNPGTYWHSQWSGGEPEPPHYVTFDMGAVYTLHGIALMNRYFEGDWATDGHGQPKNIQIYVSLDGEEWTDNGGFSNLPHPEGQPFPKFFFNVYNEARYIKVVVTDVYATNSTSIAEFGVF